MLLLLCNGLGNEGGGDNATHPQYLCMGSSLMDIIHHASRYVLHLYNAGVIVC